ncbi:MAG: hypothetical protein MUE85_12060 [Microscillaceae bacterium]|jgi:uncharacterized repeat protein (TIGR03806 family)|nr:hypothetical protein [Microscillaceae bacterium]
MKKIHLLALAIAIYLLTIAGIPKSAQTAKWKEKLSDYGFFEGKMADLKPRKGVIPYDLNTPLFSDYAHKARFVKLPKNAKITYNAQEVFDFPIGTILIKNFYYDNDSRDKAKGRKILETRLLIHESEGWLALPYVWNDAQTEAYLEIAGERRDIAWLDEEGISQSLNYAIPNMNQCKGCHNRNEKMIPIGPSARQLNGDFAYPEGKANQLLYWQKLGILQGLPTDFQQVPKFPIWNKPETGTLEARARAYLDINCGHCHQPNAPASTTGLHLHIHETNLTALGIQKPPVAAGRGAGNYLYSIVPGKPEESMLIYRMESGDPGVMMPELGRKMVHQAGAALISEWIKKMPQ